MSGFYLTLTKMGQKKTEIYFFGRGIQNFHFKEKFIYFGEGGNLNIYNLQIVHKYYRVSAKL